MTFSRLSLQPVSSGGVKAYVLACVATLLVGALTFPFREEIGNANVIMLFLLEVFLCALWLGQKPSLLAALLAVFLFDFFFVPPQYALLTNSLKYSVMLVVMLLIALLAGQMAARLLAQNRELQASEERTRALYRMARELAGAANPQQVEEIAARYPAHSATGSLLEIARQRLHYAGLAQASHVQVEAERLRASILASLSHDLRTPLAVLVGLTETLNVQGGQLPLMVQRNMLEAVHEQAVRLADMVTKLLDLARLSAGKLTLNKEWQSLEEVTGSALGLLKPLLSQRHQHVQIMIPPDFPLLEFDAVLIERVIGNLLENAVKHCPDHSFIRVSAHLAGDCADLCIADNGPGFPPHVLLMNTADTPAGKRDATLVSTGLGLAICAEILKAHQGQLRLEPCPGGGACACFTLPLGIPPFMEGEPEEEPLSNE
jgi:K+-sensing histidine kinase KdpD